MDKESEERTSLGAPITLTPPEHKELLTKLDEIDGKIEFTAGELAQRLGDRIGFLVGIPYGLLIALLIFMFFFMG